MFCFAQHVGNEHWFASLNQDVDNCASFIGIPLASAMQQIVYCCVNLGVVQV
jgi:hypothetical protein